MSAGRYIVRRGFYLAGMRLEVGALVEIPDADAGPLLDLNRIQPADDATSKRIGQRLSISPRTVDVYRARLMRQTGAATTPDLVHKLLAG